MFDFNLDVLIRTSFFVIAWHIVKFSKERKVCKNEHKVSQREERNYELFDDLIYKFKKYRIQRKAMIEYELRCSKFIRNEECRLEASAYNRSKLSTFQREGRDYELLHVLKFLLRCKFQKYRHGGRHVKYIAGSQYTRSYMDFIKEEIRRLETPAYERPKLSPSQRKERDYELLDALKFLLRHKKRQIREILIYDGYIFWGLIILFILLGFYNNGTLDMETD